MEATKSFFQSWSPAARLTIAYVAIIMLVSVIFSVTIYDISSSQLSQTLNREYARYDHYIDREEGFIVPPNIGPAPSMGLVQKDLEAGETRLQIRLVYFNLIILIFGSLASYWLAKRTLRPMEEALEAQSRFAADASHELRTPLAAMQAEIEVMLRKPTYLKSDAIALLQSNLEEVSKLKNLAEGLLRLAREEGSSELPLKPVSIEAVAVDALNRIIPMAQAKDIAIDNTVSDAMITGDKDSLTELIVILLDNAVKYSEPKTTVELSSKKAGHQVWLMVADQGQGIKPQDIPHIFDRFYRTDTSRSKGRTDGYGLGLSIARKIAGLNHASIDVRSTVGKGSTFTVKLPVTPN